MASTPSCGAAGRVSSCARCKPIAASFRSMSGGSMSPVSMISATAFSLPSTPPAATARQHRLNPPPIARLLPSSIGWMKFDSARRVVRASGEMAARAEAGRRPRLAEVAMRDCLPRSSGGDRRPAALAALVVAALVSMTGSLAAAEYHQAPMLDELVKSGKLPPVDQRLPENPRVITPVEKVGKYGGTWRSGMVGGSDRNWLFRIAGYEPLLAWDREWSGKVIPNLAEEVTSNQDATEFTVKLRKGLKWSDGKPFGSDDVGFFVSDIVANKELLPNSID